MSINLLNKKFLAPYPQNKGVYQRIQQDYYWRHVAFGKLVAMKVACQFKKLGWQVFVAPEMSLLDLALKIDILVSKDGKDWIGLQVKPGIHNAKKHFLYYGDGVEPRKGLGLASKYDCPNVVLIGNDNELIYVTKDMSMYLVTEDSLEGQLMDKPPKLFKLEQRQRRY